LSLKEILPIYMSSSTPKKIAENQYEIEADSNFGMRVPVRIYADEALLEKMVLGRTINQANTTRDSTCCRNTKII